MNGDRRQGGGGGGAQKQEGEDVITVTHVVTPTMFYGQRSGDMNDLIHITESIGAVCASSPGLTEKPVKDKVYATKFSEDDQWYRCEVFWFNNEEKRLKVRFVDYGNVEDKAWSEMVELPASLSSVKKVAQCFVLYGLRPKYERGTSGYDQGRELLKSMIDLNQCRVKVFTSIKDNFIPVIIENEQGQDVNQRMLNGGFADRLFGGHKPQGQWKNERGPGGAGAGGKNKSLLEKLQKPTFQNAGGDGHAQPTSQSGGLFSPQRNTTTATHPQHKPHQHNQQPPNHQIPNQQQKQPTPEPRQPQTFQAPPAAESSPAVGDPCIEVTYLKAITSYKSRIETLESENKQLKTELQLSRDKMDVSSKDSDRRSIEIAELRGRIVTLEHDKQKVIREKQEATLDSKIKTLLEGVNKVKELRTQFPTDQCTRDGIESAIDLVTDEATHISSELEVTRAVRDKQQLYHAVQDAIRNCKDKNGSLESFITGRNDARKQLHAAIAHFSHVVLQLPLEERSAQLVQQIKALSSSHANYLSMKTASVFGISEIVVNYSQWRKSKQASFQEVRTCTNTVHNTVSSYLARLRQKLSLDSLSGEVSSLKTNLDEHFSHFLKAVGTEVAVTDLEKKEDARFIAEALGTLMTEMQSELENIENLRQLDAQYRQTQEEIGAWLDTTPDVSEIKAVRSTIKGLKSKLRHKLADLSDLEESDESGSDELVTIAGELTQIRNQLHAAFSLEQTLLANLAELTERHFPELLLTFSELGLANELEYGGLVKLGRSMDQFDVKPVCADKASVKSAQFNQETVVIKEFLIGANMGASKQDFLGRAVAFAKIKCPRLMPLQAVFFQKGEQHVFVQIPHFAQSLYQFVTENGPVSDQVVYEVTKSVAEALSELHACDMVHGAVHPRNVFMDQPHTAVLAEYDFTKSAKQRTDKSYTLNGLKFCSNEVLVLQSASVHPSSDMYCLGLLMLWMYHPKDVFKLGTNAVPQYTLNDVPGWIQQIIDNLLGDTPSKRYTASTLLNLPSFRESPFKKSPPPVDPELLTLQLSRKAPSPPGTIEKHGILKSTSPTSPSTDFNSTSFSTDLKSTSPTTDFDSASLISDLKSTSPTTDIISANLISDLKSTSPTTDINSANLTADHKSTSPTTDFDSASLINDLKLASPSSDVLRDEEKEYFSNGESIDRGADDVLDSLLEKEFSTPFYPQTDDVTTTSHAAPSPTLPDITTEGHPEGMENSINENHGQNKDKIESMNDRQNGPVIDENERVTGESVSQYSTSQECVHTTTESAMTIIDALSDAAIDGVSEGNDHEKELLAVREELMKTSESAENQELSELDESRKLVDKLKTDTTAGDSAFDMESLEKLLAQSRQENTAQNETITEL